jgi:hypothetical protein
MKCNEADDMTFGFRHGVCAGQNGVLGRDVISICLSTSI